MEKEQEHWFFFSMSCIGPLLKEVLGGGIVRLDFDDGR